MQEEVENRTLTLVVSGTKFTGRMFKAAISYFPGGRAAGEHLPDSRQRPWYQLHRG